MTNEEYQRIKEAEKAHLRQIRELKGKLKSAQQYVKVKGALNEMEKGASAVSETHEEKIQQLRQHNAETEARMEIALENLPPATPSDEVIQQQNAQALLAQFKAEMGVVKQDVPPSPNPEATGKSIGKLPTSDAQQSPEILPDARTIGRKRF